MKTNQETTKFKFGRNPLSLIIVLAALGILFLIFFPIYSYSSTWKNNNVTPFETYYKTSSTDSDTVKEKKTKRLSTSLPSGITDLKTEDSTYEIYKMKGKDFNLFDVEINCTAYNNNHDGADAATFKVTMKWKDNTKEDLGTNTLVPFSNDNKKDIKMAGCFAADWVGFCKYQTTNSLLSSTITPQESESEYSGAAFSAISIDGLDYFPAKAKTWPIPMSAKTPDLFLYVEFKYQHNGIKTRIYILQYTFDEYNPGAKAGGIYSK